MSGDERAVGRATRQRPRPWPNTLEVFDMAEVTHLVLAQREVARLAAVLKANPGCCVYCGMPATERDHLVNRIILPDPQMRRWSPTVPACHRCNMVLGAFLSVSVRERCRHIAGKERKHGAKTLRAIPRTDEELAKYGPHLRSQLIDVLAAQEVLLFRLANLDVGGIGDARFVVHIAA